MEQLIEITPSQILKENGIEMKNIGYCKFVLVHNGKAIHRPDEPEKCYQLIIDQFGITEPRLIRQKICTI